MTPPPHHPHRTWTEARPLGLWLSVGLVCALWALAGCSRDVSLGQTQARASIQDRYEVHRRAASRAVATCVGAPCVRTRAQGAVGPGAAPCLNGSGGSCTARLEVRADGPPLPSGATLSLPVTGASSLRLTLRNVAPPELAAALRVVAVLVEERCQGKPCVGSPGFVCTRGPKDLPCAAAQQIALVPESASLPGARRHDIHLTRTEHALPGQEAVVRVIVAGDPALTSGPWVGHARPLAGAPHLAVVQSTVVMPWQGQATPSHATVDLANTGDAPAEIYGVAIEGSDAFVFRAPGSKLWLRSLSPLATPWVVQPGVTAHLPVRFTPGDSAKKHAKVTVWSNDSTVSAALIGNDSAPCMMVSPSKPLALGLLQPGDCAERRLDVHSCGSGVLAVTSVVAEGDGLTASLSNASSGGVSLPSHSAPALIASGGARKLRVRFCPDKPGPFKGRVQVSADGLPTRTIPVTAETVSSLCPVAAFDVAEGSDVLPLQTVHLDASASHAPTPGALSYTWTATGPSSRTWSTQTAKTTFHAALAGVHTLCLTVTDAAGHPSCTPSCASVTAVPEDALHVELVWSTPSDPNENDVGAGAGSDLDLHLAHPLAAGPDLDCDGAGDPWFHKVHDTYWANDAPSWGSAAPKADDDPALLRDDTDGAGPEVVALPSPEPLAAPYQIAVHYWNDHGFGVAQARVRVHLNGTLAATFGPQAMQPLDLWTVAKVGFAVDAAGQPAGAAGAPPATPTLAACWQASPACGQMWAASGAPCLTPCYLPASPPATNHAPPCAP